MVNAEWHLGPDNCRASQHGNPSGSFSEKKKKKERKHQVPFQKRKERKKKKIMLVRKFIALWSALTKKIVGTRVSFCLPGQLVISETLVSSHPFPSLSSVLLTIRVTLTIQSNIQGTITRGHVLTAAQVGKNSSVKG
jgi:hypothetical protein